MFISLQVREGVAVIATQQEMQEIAHRIQPAHGSCPTVEEWAGILQKEENRAVKNGLFDLVVFCLQRQVQIQFNVTDAIDHKLPVFTDIINMSP